MKLNSFAGREKPTILMLLKRERNVELLEETFAQSCRFVRQDQFETSQADVDMIVTDLASMIENKIWIDQRRVSDPGFLPILGLLNADEHASVNLEVFDDVVRIPCSRSELKNRFRVLIHTRQLSLERIELTSKLEAIIEHAPAAIALWRGEEMVHEIANVEFEKIWDRPMKGRALLEAAPELKDQEFPSIIQNVLHTGVTHTGHEARAEITNPKTGLREERFYDFTYTQVRDPRGRAYGVFDHAIDVTPRVLANRAILESNRRATEAENLLRQAVAVANVGFYNWHIQENKFELSEQFEKDWGLKSGSTLEDALNLIIPTDRSRTSEAIEAAMRDHTNYASQYRIIRPTDGALVWIDARGAVTYDESGEPVRFFGTSVDITAQKNSEAAISDSRDEADRANSAKSSFLANMSHEIRSPLGAIIGFAELLKAGDLAQSSVTDYATVIERNSNHLLRIVDDILDLSKIEAGKMTFEHFDFSLTNLLEDFLVLFKFKASEKGIAFDIKQTSSLPTRVVSDPTRVRQILTNIVGNAVKFTDKGFVRLDVSFEDHKLKFVVTDSGTGMTSEQSAKLFQPFQQADVSTTRKFGGTGLGLHLTRRLTSAMGGSFNLLSSELGRGTKFEAVIEVADSPTALMTSSIWTSGEIAPENRIQTNRDDSLRGMRVLLIEDSVDNQVLLKMILGQMGAAVTIAKDGVDGLKAADEGYPDLILCDIQMPRMDGYETVSALRARGFDKPILALSAHAMKEEREKALALGFSGYLTKPIQREVLSEALQTFASKLVHARANT